MLIPFRLNQHIEDLTFGINSPPQTNHAAINFEIDLVQMPSRVRFWSALTQVRGDQGPEMVHPAPNGFVGNRDTTFRQ